MKNIIIFTAFATLIAFIQGCGSSAHASLPEVGYTVLHEDHNNDYTSDTNKSAIIFRDQSEYERELALRTNAAPANIDFEASVVLMLDMGTRNSSGHNIQLKSISESDNFIVATVELSLPGNCNVDGALTNPYQFIAIETKKDILITEELVSRTCS